MKLLLVALTMLSAAIAGPPPNIVLILADDLGYGSLGCYGGAHVSTPACDRLAREGRRFTNAYAPGSVCSPSRYALMTGRLIWRTHVNHGYGLGDRNPLLIEPDRFNLASLARGRGYGTAAVGKWHIGLGAAETTDWNRPLTPGPLSVGFEYFFGLAANVANHPQAFIEGDQLLGRTPNRHITIEGTGKDRKTLGIEPLRKPDEVMATLTGKAVQWITANRNRPFFLYFAPNAVHDPITPSARFAGSPLGPYGDFIAELDASVGQLLGTLDRLKLADDTLVIFTSDNGGAVAPNSPEHQQAMDAGLAINGPWRDGKHSIYEGGFRVPFIVRWPGKVPANEVSPQMICLTDLLPTLAGILGARVPAGAAEDGLDVGSAWFGPPDARPARTGVVLQAARASEYAVREGDWKLIEHENRPVPQFREKRLEESVIRQREGQPKRDELFNLAEDPGETRDVAARHPDIVARLRKALADARAPKKESESRPRPEVWMVPPASPDGLCFRELFTDPEKWKETRSLVDVLGYADHMLHRQFTDDELRAWLPQIEKWGLRLGLEVGAIKPWGQTGQKAFEVQRPKWDRFQSLGGKIYSVAMDEPLICCRAHIHKPDEYAVEQTAQFIALVRKHYPGMRIGDIEAYPSVKAADLLAFIDALQARLKQMNVRGLDFFRLDVDWNHFNFGNGNWAEVKKLELACHQRKVPFSLIYWAANYPAMRRLGVADDSTWHVGVMRQGYDYLFVNGAPDQIVVQSWVGAPSRAVPETDEWTFTRSVRDFVKRFAPLGTSDRP
ncbi:MAG: sulfatase-like hydrolase/transferase [Verrucomicrobiae bacterium]|nr:sulfatase-like hydrolase/transferase [Verrucomicrobiae bacterium]